MNGREGMAKLSSICADQHSPRWSQLKIAATHLLPIHRILCRCLNADAHLSCLGLPQFDRHCGSESLLALGGNQDSNVLGHAGCASAGTGARCWCKDGNDTTAGGVPATERGMYSPGALLARVSEIRPSSRTVTVFHGTRRSPAPGAGDRNNRLYAQ
ncbi:hypothetical protein CALVIDRAFT_91208 [Calocera viscosa TUFC12733]|uniref:Uncharacterized protein n=1 Tax=Calocera viscosa (strain TUFC12733) TaxID=1330018 RepID=A0A167MTA4_CALVF|nr:hypothetical protein CALVIDRAFT_91208 [Calocera viscosa TUFC12733]